MQSCSIADELSEAQHLLLRATEKGDVAGAAAILRRPERPSGQQLLRSTHDSNGIPPLHLACKLGHTKLVRLLLEEGASAAEPDRDPKRRGTAISYAAWGGHIPVMDLLLDEAGSTLDEVDIVGNTPMLYAVYGGHRHVVDELLGRGRSLHEINDKLHSALLQASCGGHTKLVDWLIGQGFSLADADSDGNTALLFAAWGGFLETMKLLLSHGASLTEKNNNGHTVLLSAANGGRIEVVKWLLEQGFSLSETNNNGDTCLLLAAYGGHVPLVAWLYERGVSPHERNNCGFTPLLSAANGGQLDMVKWLISNGAKITECDEDGYTPLILAACGGSIPMVEYFLGLGASVTETNENGDTPLLLAAYCGHAQLIGWLLNHGSSLKERNKTDMGPLISAANGGNYDAVRLLLRRIAEGGAGCGDGLENTDQGGYTPLLLAAQRGHLRVVRLLATHGAKLDAVTSQSRQGAVELSTPGVALYLGTIAGKSPLTIAAEAGDLDRVHTLVLEATTAELRRAADSQRAVPDLSGAAAAAAAAAAAGVTGFSDFASPVPGAGPSTDVTPEVPEPLRDPSAPFASAAAAAAVLPAAIPGGGSPRSRHLRPPFRLIRMALKPWAPSRHQLFGATTRRRVFNLFMVQHKLGRLDLPHLPKEIWFAIASFFGRAADESPRSGQEKKSRRLALYGHPIGLTPADREMWCARHRLIGPTESDAAGTIPTNRKLVFHADGDSAVTVHLEPMDT